MDLNKLASAKATSFSAFENFDPQRVASPAFVVDVRALEANLAILSEVGKASGAKILAALKAFSMHSAGELFQQYLAGAAASGPHEARLAREYFAGEQGLVHTYSAAFKADEFAEVLRYSDHVIFNSPSQLEKLSRAFDLDRSNHRFGLRVNPLHSEGAVGIYDPCRQGSRMGTPITQLQNAELGDFPLLTGLHFHTLCEQGFDALDRTLAVIERSIPHWLEAAEWLNLGGGHHITAESYDRNALVQRLRELRERYQLEIYLEPGEACSIDSGLFIAEVLDVMENDGKIAILDASATCHMPDVIEMPYTPDIIGARPCSKPTSNTSQQPSSERVYTLGGPSCLTGDEIGRYHFNEPLTPGARIKFLDMAIYSMVKTNTFNGIPLPDLVLWDSRDDRILHTRRFGYDDFKTRLS